MRGIEVGMTVEEQQAVAAAPPQRQGAAEQDAAVAADHDGEFAAVDDPADGVGQARRILGQALGIEHGRRALAHRIVLGRLHALIAPGVERARQADLQQDLRRAFDAAGPQAERRGGLDDGEACHERILPPYRCAAGCSSAPRESCWRATGSSAPTSRTPPTICIAPSRSPRNSMAPTTPNTGTSARKNEKMLAGMWRSATRCSQKGRANCSIPEMNAHSSACAVIAGQPSMMPRPCAASTRRTTNRLPAANCMAHRTSGAMPATTRRLMTA